MRCPSEVLAVRWEDVNWEHNRIRVPSPKTERHEGGASRIIPLFPELRPILLEAFEEADPGEEYVVTSCRSTKANLRTQMHRIIRRAGLEPWPKTFQNLRSTRETELAEQYPIHVVCKWIGNSAAIAATHYLQLTDDHFARAARENNQSKATQNPTQKVHETARNGQNGQQERVDENPSNSRDFMKKRLSTAECERRLMTPTGFEPVLPG
ncbi:MAG: tyrosine-type recombinase/integrase [Phycisphaeraceae bacterium]